MLKGKQRKATSWLSSQVVYGVDTSDPDPANWQAFGDEHERQEELKKHSNSAAKRDPRERSAQVEE